MATSYHRILDLSQRSMMETLSRRLYVILVALITIVAESGANCGLQQCQTWQSSGLPSISSPKNSSSNKLLGLLQASGYDTMTRPHFLQGKPEEITFDIFVNSFDSVSVEYMDFSLNIYLRMSWVDPRLRYAHVYPNITSPLTVDTRMFDLIWVPDVFFPNEKESHRHCITVPNRLIRIAPDGRVLYSARYSLRLSCHMSLIFFPVDKQQCWLKLESYGYTLADAVFHWSKDDLPIQINEHLELPQFELHNFTTGECNKSYITGNFTCLKAIFYLDRKFGYYMIQNYLPSFMIVALSWVSFWINIDAIPARISLGVLTVLTMTTQSVGVWMSLPTVSYVKAIDVWMSTCVMFVFLAMLEFAIVNTLARKEIRQMSMRARANNKNGDSPHDLVKRMMDEYTYGKPKQLDPASRMIARRIDKAARTMFPASFVTFCIVYWTTYLTLR